MQRMDAASHTDDDARYRALCSRDARFDGQWFVGVTSTGIYCRPVCRVRTPKQDNCRFFDHAAQAEQAGFRPCLRCRPELAPQQRHWSHEDAAGILLQQAMHWLDNPQHWGTTDGEAPTLERLATRLGVSCRHLRRVFESLLGVSPLQYLLTRKQLCAKQLLTDTNLPITAVAQASGFSSLRRFNAAFRHHYGLAPTQLRQRTGSNAPVPACRPVRLTWRPPFDAATMLRFMADRQLDGVEQVAPAQGIYARTVRLQQAGRTHTGWFSAHFEARAQRLQLTLSDGLQPALPQLIRRVRALFDLDVDPQPINALLHDDFPGGDGLRVPGTTDGFELAVRAVLGQQVRVGAARTLVCRLVETVGQPLTTGQPGLRFLFPEPETVACLEPAVLGSLGIVRQRQTALLALARAVADGRLSLDLGDDPEHTVQALCALPGIGPWTAQYIALRALRWPDAWPTGDVALTRQLGLPEHRSAQAQRKAQALAQNWQPWRGYAVVRAWAGTHRSQASTT